MSEGKKINLSLIIKTVIIWVVASLIAVLIFANAMYFLESGYEFSPLFATISVAIGCFFASLFAGNKLGKNGILIGVSIGGITFLLITLITLLVNSGAVSVHILLRLVILILASLIGSIIGVNRKAEQKYI